MKAKKILYITIRILFGIIFIFSGIVKLYPIEPFEVLVTDAGIANWTIAPYLARILISFEIAMGILIIINLLPKHIIKLSLITLLSFNLYLLYTIIFRKDISDCGCFGNMINLTPWQSFIKNIILLIWGYFILKTNQTEIRKFKWLIGISIVLASFAYPFIISPPDALFDYETTSDRVGEKLDLKIFGEPQFNNGYHSIDKGRVVLAFFSLKCKFCKYAAMKLAIINREQTKPIPLYIVFWDLPDEEAVNDFHTFTKSGNIPYKLLPGKEFLALSGPSLPAIFFLEDGVIKKKTGFRTLKPEEVTEFLRLKE